MFKRSIQGVSKHLPNLSSYFYFHTSLCFHPPAHLFVKYPYPHPLIYVFICLTLIPTSSNPPPSAPIDTYLLARHLGITPRILANAGKFLFFGYRFVLLYFTFPRVVVVGRSPLNWNRDVKQKEGGKRI